MPNPKRPARGKAGKKCTGKAGKNWTLDQLNAYNIRINTVDTRAFFGFSDLPAPVLFSPESIITSHVKPPAGLQLSNDDRRFFAYLNDTTLDKGFVNDFAGQLLTVMGLELPTGRIVNQRIPLPFIMNKRRVKAIPNFLLQDREEYILLLVETETVSFPSLALWPRFPDTYKASSRQRRASAGGLCYRSIYIRQCQAHPLRASSAAFQKVHWHHHD
jgi:hypothetical protein